MHDYMKSLIKECFPRYKRVQIGATIQEVKIKIKNLESMTRFLGIPIKRKYTYSEVTIPFVEFRIAYRPLYGVAEVDRYKMNVAVDEKNKTVYWNYNKLPDKWIHGEKKNP